MVGMLVKVGRFEEDTMAETHDEDVVALIVLVEEPVLLSL